MAKTDKALKNIYLCGFMCSGKTSAGRKLAALLRRPFADTDALAARAAGTTVAAYIRRRGLAAFRTLEAAALRRAAAKGGSVVALGGGLNPGGRQGALLRRTGVSVYLHCEWAELESRLRRARAGRPLLDGSWPRAAAKAARLLAARLPGYRRADLQVKAGLTPGETAAAIKKLLGKGGHI